PSRRASGLRRAAGRARARAGWCPRQACAWCARRRRTRSLPARRSGPDRTCCAAARSAAASWFDRGSPPYRQLRPQPAIRSSGTRPACFGAASDRLLDQLDVARLEPLEERARLALVELLVLRLDRDEELVVRGRREALGIEHRMVVPRQLVEPEH